VAFVLQAGDLVEGLCGNENLAARQNREALEFVRGAELGAPFFFTKGNHDITGDGAPAAFKELFLPFLREQTRAFASHTAAAGACYALEHGNAMLCCFDAYDPTSLDWLEAALARRTSQHCFVAIHPPVVPYGARATWYVYSKEKDRGRREKLLSLLGKNNAFVLGGHIHKFSTLSRRTPDTGRFAQLAVSSVIKTPSLKPRNVLTGIAEYTGDQVRVEPRYSPDTEAQRRAVLEAERPLLGAFDYADLPGYAVIVVKGAKVDARIYSGATRELWRTVALSELLVG
jgi:3',5'-cyclic AMP phosphodiesterase CpdA